MAGLGYEGTVSSPVVKEGLIESQGENCSHEVSG